jgi:hypothetical protein
MSQSRQSKGQPTGGQFAAKSNPESEIELDDQPRPVVKTPSEEAQEWHQIEPEWTDEELIVDDLRAMLVDAGLPNVYYDGPYFKEMAEGITAWINSDSSGTVRAASITDVQQAIEYGFDQTNDVDGPNFTFMAQVVYDRFLKVNPPDSPPSQ